MRTFSQVLAALPGGRTEQALTEKLAELVLAVAAANKKGSITLTLTVLPNADNMVVIEDTVAMKAPMMARGKGHFYFDEDGSLSQSNPRQSELPLREVATKPAAPPRRISTASAALAAMEEEDKRQVAAE